MINVFINGYGTVGKRVADAVALQKDMKIIGVSKRTPDFDAEQAIKKGFDLYCVEGADVDAFKKRGLETNGYLKDIKDSVDVVIDGAPGKQGGKNMELYKSLGINAIFQGGEDASIGTSFNAHANFDKNVGQKYIRVVSCNTTGLARTLSCINEANAIKKVKAVMIRRAADPGDNKKGPINAIVPEVKVPSHHGPDLKTVLPIDIETIAVKVPTTLMHLHTIMVDLKKDIKREDVIDLFNNRSRVILVSKEEGIDSTADIMEYAKNLGRNRGDMYEINVWKDSISVKDGMLYYIQAIHQESDIVPENVDAIRAMFDLKKRDESIEMTNKAMGIL
ncbi:MAG TPA: type II glyceraldehyde-3-phosphate dehydrogenase [Methanofastidiosum sp.]|jgi:glyceraldehyde-3-phosphate dehydrogenase (NAD(P))|nr:type II glyceraldehyde-3-phosphate dehydrogenase [Methanofastidiosum sp.]HNZ87416.1 type II glyceraldehyde-3-phosphate dehydrogenase [Methanofastidiosum sp.]HOC78053.1 type II glyceraldehyde-3-phosphate dehydrogenase [Methanofastidiosum sp.]HOG73814.1 type II glyceraldehyde-3-phosphate dehydrogenase [Methanofastidiosum sp.]HPA49357.1 type II glyceraldehyde-3-phosphate dehydrogenase [Methanofastidiosum sp.]